jgi:hypothetical protein
VGVVISRVGACGFVSCGVDFIADNEVNFLLFNLAFFASLFNRSSRDVGAAGVSSSVLFIFRFIGEEGILLLDDDSDLVTDLEGLGGSSDCFRRLDIKHKVTYILCQAKVYQHEF